jgi:ESF2/ABP1 family protein
VTLWRRDVSLLPPKPQPATIPTFETALHTSDLRDKSTAAVSAFSIYMEGPSELQREALDKFGSDQRKRGLIYLSRVPPHMSPEKIRRLMEPFGTIGRVYLAPEDPSLRRRRMRLGGSKRKTYTEGWIEFMDKRIARAVARSLNSTPIGGKGFHKSDLWNLKYLPGFKWSHLTEKVAYEGRIRDARTRAEIADQRKDAAFYMTKVEQGRRISAMEARKTAKRKRTEGDGEGEGGGKGGGGEADRTRVRRTFSQRAPRAGAEERALRDESVLKKVFSSKRRRVDGDGDGKKKA